MAVRCNLIMRSGVEDDIVLDGVGQLSKTLDAFDFKAVLDADSAPPVTKVCAGTLMLAAGVATLDLSAVPYNGAAVDLTGLKVQMLFLRNLSLNPITISEGASNGYQLLGGAALLVPAASRMQFFWSDTLPDVSATDRTLDLSGTATDELQFVLAAG